MSIINIVGHRKLGRTIPVVQDLLTLINAAWTGNTSDFALFGMDQGIVSSGSNLVSWQQIGGGVSYTPVSSAPTIESGGIRFTGAELLTAASKFGMGLDNWAIVVIRQASRSVIDGNRILAYIGNPSSNGYGPTTCTPSSGPSSQGAQNSIGGLIGNKAWISSGLTLNQEYSDDNIITDRVDQTFRCLNGVITSREHSIPAPGATTGYTPDVTLSNLSYIGGDGIHDNAKGLIVAVGYFHNDPGGSALDNVEKLMRMAYGVPELFTSRQLPADDAWTTLAQMGAGETTFGDWGASGASEGGTPIIDSSPPSPLVSPAIKIHYLNTLVDGTSTDRNAGVDFVPTTGINYHYFTRFTGIYKLDSTLDLSPSTGRKFFYFQEFTLSRSIWIIVGAIGNQVNCSVQWKADGGSAPFNLNIQPVTLIGGDDLKFELVQAWETGLNKRDGYIHLKINDVLVHRSFNARWSQASDIGTIDPETQLAWRVLRVGNQVDQIKFFDEYRWVKAPKLEIAAVPL